VRPLCHVRVTPPPRAHLGDGPAYASAASRRNRGYDDRGAGRGYGRGGYAMRGRSPPRGGRMMGRGPSPRGGGRRPSPPRRGGSPGRRRRSRYTEFISPQFLIPIRNPRRLFHLAARSRRCSMLPPGNPASARYWEREQCAHVHVNVLTNARKHGHAKRRSRSRSRSRGRGRSYSRSSSSSYSSSSS
jgi:hypothetical protein